MKQLGILLGFLLIFQGCIGEGAHASVNTLSSYTKGYSVSRDNAIRNALDQATKETGLDPLEIIQFAIRKFRENKSDQFTCDPRCFDPGYGSNNPDNQDMGLKSLFDEEDKPKPDSDQVVKQISKHQQESPSGGSSSNEDHPVKKADTQTIDEVDYYGLKKLFNQESADVKETNPGSDSHDDDQSSDSDQKELGTKDEKGNNIIDSSKQLLKKILSKSSEKLLSRYSKANKKDQGAPGIGGDSGSIEGSTKSEDSSDLEKLSAEQTETTSPEPESDESVTQEVASEENSSAVEKPGHDEKEINKEADKPTESPVDDNKANNNTLPALEENKEPADGARKQTNKQSKRKRYRHSYNHSYSWSGGNNWPESKSKNRRGPPGMAALSSLPPIGPTVVVMPYHPSLWSSPYNMPYQNMSKKQKKRMNQSFSALHTGGPGGFTGAYAGALAGGPGAYATAAAGHSGSYAIAHSSNPAEARRPKKRARPSDE